MTSFVDLMGCVLAENRDSDLFAMVVWAVWKRRNDMRVGKSGVTLPDLVQQARSRLHDFLLHNFADVKPGARPQPNGSPQRTNSTKLTLMGHFLRLRTRLE